MIILSWGPCVLSALAGSALTAFALCWQSPSPTNVDKNATENGRSKRIQREDDAPGNREGEKVDSTSQEDVDGNPCRPNTRWRPFTRQTRASFSGSFNGVDGEKRNSIASLSNEENYADVSTNVLVLSEHLMGDEAVMKAQEFDRQVVSKLATLDESKLLLHRTRAVSALASPLMAAPDEESCYDVVSRLLVPLFRVDRCSYALMKDAEHIVVKAVIVNDRRHATKIGLDGKKFGGVVKPLKDTMVGVCAETLQQQYCPRTKDSHLANQRMMHSIGINSILATPILVNDLKFAGCIVISSVKENAFREYDRILIRDIASMLGAHIYSKRMRKAAEESHKISREMLHAFIPAKVIEKIAPFWDENSDEYQSRRASTGSASPESYLRDSGTCSSDHSDDSLENEGGERTHSRPICRSKTVNEKINFLQQVTLSDGGDAGFMVDTSSMEIGSPLVRALYAENVKDVVIIFTDIVGFSKMSLCMKPLEVMDMLQALFSRFDALCDTHGVQKLETIGDAYICTANLFDEGQFGGNVKEAALSALNMAKDMVLVAQEVILPGRVSRKKNSLFGKLEIRVGMHVGEVTCGVLGERLPKFAVFGHHVNLAARMEQTSKPSKIRVSEPLHSLVVDESEEDWGECELVQMKNMGDCKTYILDPYLNHNNF